MKLIKYLLFLILIIIIGGAIYFGTQDGSFDAAESKIMEVPAQVVYDQVKDYKTWEEWGPWMAIDSTIQIDYAEKTEGEGAAYSWNSKHRDVGDGAMETVKVIPNKEIEQKITFNTPIGDSKSDVYWRFEETETPGQTKVTWGMKGESSFMEKVMMGLFSDKDMETEIKKMYAQGLANIEMIAKKVMEEYTINVDGISQYGGGYYMYVATASKLNEISEKMAPTLGQVAGFMQQNNITSSGMPFTIYNDIDTTNGTVIFSACIPVREQVITPIGSLVLCSFMEPLSAVKTTLKGKYKNLPVAYAKANDYVDQNNLIVDVSKKMFEVYANDPGDYPNPADWLTEIYLPVFKDLRSNHPIINGEN